MKFTKINYLCLITLLIASNTSHAMWPWSNTQFTPEQKARHLFNFLKHAIVTELHKKVEEARAEYEDEELRFVLECTRVPHIGNREFLYGTREFLFSAYDRGRRTQSRYDEHYESPGVIVTTLNRFKLPQEATLTFQKLLVRLVINKKLNDSGPWRSNDDERSYLLEERNRLELFPLEKRLPDLQQEHLRRYLQSVFFNEGFVPSTSASALTVQLDNSFLFCLSFVHCDDKNDRQKDRQFRLTAYTTDNRQLYTELLTKEQLQEKLGYECQQPATLRAAQALISLLVFNSTACKDIQSRKKTPRQVDDERKALVEQFKANCFKEDKAEAQEKVIEVARK